jgi:hypothetical protein
MVTTMQLRHLLIITAVIEIGTGLALSLSPSAPFAILHGTSLDTWLVLREPRSSPLVSFAVLRGMTYRAAQRGG